MEMLMILTYTSICYAIFKVFKLPLNKWTVPTAFLGGIILLGSTMLLMNYNHPYTKVARTVVVTTPIVPLVRGRVVEVPVKPNTPLKKGAVLFRIDPTIFKASVAELEASLAQALQNVRINNEAWAAAKAQVGSAKAARNRAKGNYDRYLAANRRSSANPFSAAQIQNRRDTYLAAEANFNAAKAAERGARLRYESRIDGQDTEVARIRARLVKAEFNLKQTVVRAPTDGMVTQLILRPGAIAVPLPLKPTMVFVHAEQTYLVASFLQNSMLRLRAGNEAEVIFSAIPGRIFKGKIDFVLPVMAQGAVQSSGTLIAMDKPAYGRIGVLIKLEEDLSKYHLPAGVAAEVAVYTEHVEHVAMVRKILFRMKSWQNYLFGEGH